MTVFKERQVRIPFVSRDFATGEATDWNDHVYKSDQPRDSKSSSKWSIL